MKVLIEAINTPDVWKLGGSTAKLRIYANSDFQTSDGQWVPHGNHTTFYLEIACTIVASVLTIPSFEIDSTVDSPDNPSVTYTAELITTTGRRVMFLSTFAIDTLQVGDPSTTWGEIKLFRIGPALQTLDTSILRQINAMIQQAAGALTKSSANNTGVTALTRDPVDPAFPIAVGANDPAWLGIGGGEITMVDGVIVVPNTSVGLTSRPFAFSLSEGAGGPFYALQADIIPGVSFTIRSRNAGDNGLIGWRL